MSSFTNSTCFHVFPPSGEEIAELSLFASKSKSAKRVLILLLHWL